MINKVNKSWLGHDFVRKFKSSPDKYLIALLVFLLPFERIPSFELFGVTWRASLFVAVVIIIRAVTRLVKSQRKPTLNLSIILALSFIVWLAVTIPAAINFKRAISVSIFDSFAILTALSVAYLFKSDYLKLIIKALLFSASIVILFGFFQYFGNLLRLPEAITGLRSAYSWEVFGFPRIQSTALEPLYLASYLLLPLSVIIALLISRQQIVMMSRSKLLALSLFISATIFMTVSRGGTLGLIVMSALLIISSLLLKLTNWQNILKVLGTICGGLLLALLLINYVNKSPINLKTTKGKTGVKAYTSQIAKTGLEGGGDDRTKFRRLSIEIWKSSPQTMLVGIGPGQFGPVIQENKFDPVTGWAIVNNLVLEILLETGLIGLSIFSLFIISIFIAAIRFIIREHDELTKLIGLALLTYLIATFVQYMTFSTLYIIHIWVAIGLLMGLTGIVSTKDTVNKSIKQKKTPAS